MPPPSPVSKHWGDEDVHPSIPQDGDIWDELGRNLSAQKRRERMWGKWTTVRYSKKFY